MAQVLWLWWSPTHWHSPRSLWISPQKASNYCSFSTELPACNSLLECGVFSEILRLALGALKGYAQHHSVSLLRWILSLLGQRKDDCYGDFLVFQHSGNEYLFPLGLFFPSEKDSPTVCPCWKDTPTVLQYSNIRPWADPVKILNWIDEK